MERVLTRGANDPIFPHSPLCAGLCVRTAAGEAEEDRTSQFSRMKQSPLATDLRGPKAPAESLTPQRINLAVADAVDFQSDFFSSATALGSVSSLGWMSSGASLGAAVSVPPEKIVGHGIWNGSVHVLLGSQWAAGSKDLMKKGEPAPLLDRAHSPPRRRHPHPGANAPCSLPICRRLPPFPQLIRTLAETWPSNGLVVCPC